MRALLSPGFPVTALAFLWSKRDCGPLIASADCSRGKKAVVLPLGIVLIRGSATLILPDPATRLVALPALLDCPSLARST